MIFNRHDAVYPLNEHMDKLKSVSGGFFDGNAFWKPRAVVLESHRHSFFFFRYRNGYLALAAVAERVLHRVGHEFVDY